MGGNRQVVDGIAVQGKTVLVSGLEQALGGRSSCMALFRAV